MVATGTPPVESRVARTLLFHTGAGVEGDEEAGGVRADNNQHHV